MSHRTADAWTAVGIGRYALQKIRAQEQLAFARRTEQSHALHRRARRTMPLGVPMPWMASLYGHTPIYAAAGSGAWFEDVDGNRYLDMNQADWAGGLGFVPSPVAEAACRRVKQGTAFLLPVEDGVIAAEELAARTKIPFWQFTGSASAAVVEAIRIARVATGRKQTLMFEGKYHGHSDDVLIARRNGREVPQLLGLPTSVEHRARVVTFNDLDELQHALASGDIACVVAEPLLTNCGLVFPDPDFWAEATNLIHTSGAFLIIDEAHTFLMAYGGLAREWNISPDILVLGKGLGSGISFGAYGVCEPLAQLMEAKLDVGAAPGLALGGTTFANALALTAARIVLECCLTEEAYARVRGLGTRLSFGLEGLFARHGLQWRAPHIGGRSGWVLAPELPRNAFEAWSSLDADFIATRRLFMANRGVWEAIPTSGPSCSFSHEKDDVDFYLEVAGQFLAACSTGRAQLVHSLNAGASASKQGAIGCQ